MFKIMYHLKILSFEEERMTDGCQSSFPWERDIFSMYRKGGKINLIIIKINIILFRLYI